MKKSWVLHVDGDAFFASCEVSRRPDLFFKPVVVGEERGIATALTYSAKALGIKRGDPIFKIRKEYPEVTILSSHFELYRKINLNLGKILAPYVSEFEAYSIDECFAIVTGDEHEVMDKIYKMKLEVEKKLGITYSFGVSLNKTLAKVASKRKKPAGVCFLFNKESIEQALKTTKAKDIWGIGYATQKKLTLRKIQTAYEFTQMDIRNTLKDSAEPLYNTQRELLMETIFSVGISNPHQKSIQATRSFIKKTNDKCFIFSELSRNIERACGELRKAKLYTNHFFFYVKSKDKMYKNITFDIPLPNFTQDAAHMMGFIERMFDKFENGLPGLYKSSGVILMNLKIEEEMPVDLFGDQKNKIENEFGITNIIDKIRDKYGYESMQLTSSMSSNIIRRADLDARDKKDNYEYGLPFPFLGIVN